MKFRTAKKTKIIFGTPQEMYDDYKNREIEGIHDYQSKMIDDYMANAYSKDNVAMELPTGSGKTLIGLLIGEFRRRKNKEKVIYLCLTKQLVNQTVEYANRKFGIKVVGFTGAQRDYESDAKIKYSCGESIAVTNYSSLFNANPFLKDPDIIILDDAHSAENYIASNWTLSISKNDDKELYLSIADVLEDIIDDSSYKKMTDKDFGIENFAWVDKVPNTKFLGKLALLDTVISEGVKNNRLNFSWRNIRNNIHACSILNSR